MKKAHNLLKTVLSDIEKGIRNGINTDIIAGKHNLSSIHLQRLFRFTFKQSLGAYIRSRKLTVSLHDVLYTDKKIIDIALEYGYSFENSYSRSFKREFGISPDNLRNSGQIVETKPPLHLSDERTTLRQYDGKHCQMVKFIPETEKYA